MWPRFRTISTKVGLGKKKKKNLSFPLAIKKTVPKVGEEQPSFTGLAREVHIMVIQTLTVCFFLLNYLSFKNMEKRICQEQILMQGKKVCRLLFNVDLYIYI